MQNFVIEKCIPEIAPVIVRGGLSYVWKANALHESIVQSDGNIFCNTTWLTYPTGSIVDAPADGFDLEAAFNGNNNPAVLTSAELKERGVVGVYVPVRELAAY